MNSHLTRRPNANTTTDWRRDRSPPSVTAPNSEHTSSRHKQRGHRFGSNFVLALVITCVILLVQIFIVLHYFGSHKSRHALVTKRPTGEESLLLGSPGWFCHSYPHLNKILELAVKHQVQLVSVDEDLLEVLEDGDSSGKTKLREESLQFSSKTKQEASHKSIIHLAAINETSGGQPGLVAFHDDLKNYYHLLKYDDTSETMAPEVYTRQSHQLDDVQADALRDSSAPGELSRQQQQQQLDTYEISKIYTEFMAHLFVLNTTSASMSLKPNKLCESSSRLGGERPHFVVIHLFVLYNYEFRPQEEWIQSGLALTEIERHRLLAYGVHSIDFRVPLGHNYIHTKRETSPLSNARGLSGYKLDPDRPLAQMRVFEPPVRLLTYANNTYLHCKPSSFNITGLLDNSRRLHDYLRSLDASRPPRSEQQRASMAEQVSIAIQFMNVFSETYGGFSFWITGSSLLSYHKFCQLTASLAEPAGDEAEYEEDYDDGRVMLNRPTKEREPMLDLEFGLFSSEIRPNMLSDLSKAKMIGVTMMSNWRKPNSRVSFHVQDCPNVLFRLHFYELHQDFYQHFYVTNDNMIHKHKFRRKRSESSSRSSSADAGHHVFATSNLDLCWTRLDNIHPFRVPCDVHDHLRRIYVI